MILVCGEALFDMFLDGAPPAEARALGFEARVGGSPFNVAVGLSRLGARSALLTGLSGDFLGERLRAVLADEGVSLDHAPRLDAPSTISLVALSESGGAQYAFYGERAADRSLTAAHLPESLEGVPAIHMGSYSLVAQPTADALLALARREAGRRVLSIDPNVRLNVEPDLEVWRARVLELAAMADLLKTSDEDLGLLWPGEPPESAAAMLRDAGAGLVVITAGESGAQAFGENGEIRVEAPATEVVDTVGAGDSFQAALLFALDQIGALAPGRPAALGADALRQSLDFAAAAAAITCSRRGADLPRLAEVEALGRGDAS